MGKVTFDFEDQVVFGYGRQPDLEYFIFSEKSKDLEGEALQRKMDAVQSCLRKDLPEFERKFDFMSDDYLDRKLEFVKSKHHACLADLERIVRVETYMDNNFLVALEHDVEYQVSFRKKLIMASLVAFKLKTAVYYIDDAKGVDANGKYKFKKLANKGDWVVEGVGVNGIARDIYPTFNAMQKDYHVYTHTRNGDPKWIISVADYQQSLREDGVAI